jgi:hypothetical protein
MKRAILRRMKLPVGASRQDVCHRNLPDLNAIRRQGDESTEVENLARPVAGRFRGRVDLKPPINPIHDPVNPNAAGAVNACNRWVLVQFGIGDLHTAQVVDRRRVFSNTSSTIAG